MITTSLLLFIAQDPAPDRLARLEAELSALRQEFAVSREADRARYETQIAALAADLEDARRGRDGSSAASRFQWGGYGEQHYNDLDGHGGAQIDIHRFVLYMGYSFSENVQLHSETEIEHGFVEDDNGEIAIEQLWTDFRVSPTTHIQVGRVLAPLGIVNLRHEPPSFNGVERPSVETFVLPSTWSIDALGVSGEITTSLRYQLYLSGGMDGTGFSAFEGIRGGRQEERPSAHQPAVSGRLDFFPLDSLGGDASEQSLRLGLSGLYGGLDNGNQGSDPGVDADLLIAAVDAEYSIGRLDLRGVAAFEKIGGASELSTVTGESISKEIVGWYVEAAWHWMPESWKSGEHGWADAIAFARYDDIDTQRDVPSGFVADAHGDRDEWTLGIGLYPLENLVLKADYQIRNDEATGSPQNQFNLGIGWSF
ncbi:MAG TPA: hypothetical protein VK843_23035 [Planctomycetota bacterium]|nr:hypothetical protein [Planctomycetota bacterium]